MHSWLFPVKRTWHHLGFLSHLVNWCRELTGEKKKSCGRDNLCLVADTIKELWGDAGGSCGGSTGAEEMCVEPVLVKQLGFVHTK